MPAMLLPEIFVFRRGALQIPPLRFAPVGDDKGKVITHLQVCESDRELFCAIRLTEFKVSSHSPLVIPSEDRGICSAPRPDSKIPGKAQISPS